MNPTARTIKVALVEDRAEERVHLENLLRESSGFACVSACRTGEEALAVLPALRPDIVLMDIQLPRMSGVECVRQLRDALPDTQFMMLTVLEDHAQIFRALAAGATGYLLKKTKPAKLIEAIGELYAGGAPMSGQVARQVVNAFRHAPAAESPAAVLSPAERCVLERLARGLLYKEVADEMGIAISTVRTHVWHIYRKLQVNNRTEAVLKLRAAPAPAPLSEGI